MIRRTTISGLRESQRNLRAIGSPKLQNHMRGRALDAAGNEIYKEVRRSTPVRRGRLKKQLRMSRARSRGDRVIAQRRLRIIVRSGHLINLIYYTLDGFYALFLERGTGPRRHGAESRTPGRYTGRVRPLRFMAKAFRRSHRRAIVFFRRIYVKEFNQQVKQYTITNVRRARRTAVRARRRIRRAA